jgi:signal transduction histidine kinase
MVVNSLKKECPASAILSPLQALSGATDEDAPVLDLSGLTTDPPQGACGLAWIEIPLLGENGQITGVLCRSARIGIPDEAAARYDGDANRSYVHDLANLLAVIDGGLQLLDVKTSAEDRAIIVERLRRAIERGASLSRRLLDTARPPKDVVPSSHRHILDVGDLLDRTLRADVVVDTDIDPGLRLFRADAEELHLALLNLCKNASDAMPYGGTISIGARNVFVRPDGWWVEVAVADDGTGMSPEVLSRIFEPYFTTKEPGEGTGLGLDQVKRFVERSRGAMTVESVENEGTIVRMLFPCT